MLCRLTSDVDAAKADVTKAQKDAEAEKKLKLEANTMLKVRLFIVCCTMVCAFGTQTLTCFACGIGGTVWHAAKPDAAANQHMHVMLRCQYPGAPRRPACKAAVFRANDSLLSLPADASGAV